MKNNIRQIRVFLCQLEREIRWDVSCKVSERIDAQNRPVLEGVLACEHMEAVARDKDI